MQERKTLFHTYVTYDSLPERRYLRPWIRTTVFFVLNTTITAALVVLGVRLFGIG